MTPTRGLLRGLRAVSLSVVGLILALLAHLTAGVVHPGPAPLAPIPDRGPGLPSPSGGGCPEPRPKKDLSDHDPDPVPPQPTTGHLLLPSATAHPGNGHEVTDHRHHLADRWRSRALAVALATGALLTGTAGTAQAHDSLLGTSPAAGSTTVVVPARVTLTLSEPALAVGTTVIVTGPAGQVQRGRAVLAGNTITQRLRPGSPAGGYTVTWRATSSDGHPVSGRFSFTAAKASPGGSATTPALPAPTTSTPSTASATSAAAIPATSAPAVATGSTSAVWGVLAGGLVVLLLLGTFLVRRRPRSTPEGERDPRS